MQFSGHQQRFLQQEGKAVFSSAGIGRMIRRIPSSFNFCSCDAFAVLLVITFGVLSADAWAKDGHPIPLIFDTDIGNDVDDALALGVIHALESRGECKLLAVTLTKEDPLSAQFVDAINTFYGRGDIPIGMVHKGPASEPSKFTGLALEKEGQRLRYPHDLEANAKIPDAVTLLRQVLGTAQDHTVVIVQVGFSTNLARLLASPPDAISNLPGVELVRHKVHILSVMAGAFVPVDGKLPPEYNVKCDVQSAQKLAADWPTPIVYSGFEIGLAVTYPSESIQRDFAYVAHHPLAEAYILYMPPPHNRPSWDLTSVLYAVRPNGGYFDVSPPGQVHVTADGITKFEQKPTGPHRYLVLKPDQQIQAREALRQLASQPPSH